MDTRGGSDRERRDAPEGFKAGKGSATTEGVQMLKVAADARWRLEVERGEAKCARVFDRRRERHADATVVAYQSQTKSPHQKIENELDISSEAEKDEVK
ncbi:hypothetical protein FCM35_KLT02414 [Carex littledalei]|uniref:Uncharacterized protein n=1 Tax=Carex littledalei TaxID=544730 RepID=A0A833R3X2_9POAL|nr:hypothetical protein FCM35_KLT02414 [Carex littledalei]